MTEKLFTVAGTAAQNGITKVRFANDLVSRVKTLDKNGCTEINLVELPEPMTKLQALRYLKTLDLTDDSLFAVDCKLAEKTRESRRQELSAPAFARNHMEPA